MYMLIWDDICWYIYIYILNQYDLQQAWNRANFSTSCSEAPQTALTRSFPFQSREHHWEIWRTAGVTCMPLGRERPSVLSPIWLPAERSSFLIYLLKQKTGGSFPGRHYQVNFPNGKILLSGNSVISWLNMKSSVVKNTLKLLFLKRIQ